MQYDIIDSGCQIKTPLTISDERGPSRNEAERLHGKMPTDAVYPTLSPETNNSPPPRSLIVNSARRLNLVWERTTVYLQLFGVNISSGLPTSNHRSDMVLVLCSSDWTPHPHHRGSAYLSPLTTGLFGHPQEGL